MITYVDGFNLYYGLKSKGWRRYYWLDLHRLSEQLLRAHQRLVKVHYFTARIRATPGAKRQGVYLDALSTLSGLSIHYGHFLAKARHCSSCGATWQGHEEKLTDVNIAVQLLGDAQDDAFDTALLVSGDSDLTPPVTEVRRRYPAKRVVVAFPPGRHSAQLSQAANAAFTIGRKKLQDSQFPETVSKADGFALVRPAQWS